MVVMGSFVDDTPLPELSGVMPANTATEEPAASISVEAEQAAAAPSTEDPAPEKNERRNSGILKIYGITLSSALIVVVVAGFLLTHHRKKNS